MVDQSPDNQDVDRGLSAWVPVAVAVLALGLLVYPAWWLLDSYMFAESDPGEAVPAPVTTLASGVGSTVAVGPRVNLARGKPVTATGPGNDPPGRLVDGDTTMLWNSGSWPPQVVQIDLEAASTVYAIRLLTGQNPDGETQHFIFGWLEGETEPVTLHVFEGFTTDRQWLVHAPDEPWEGIDRFGVGTAASPSWVAWFEIEVVGTTP